MHNLQFQKLVLDALTELLLKHPRPPVTTLRKLQDARMDISADIRVHEKTHCLRCHEKLKGRERKLCVYCEDQAEKDES